MTQETPTDLSQESLEWLVESFSREVVEKLDDRVRKIVRDELAKCTGRDSTVSS